MPAVNQTAQHTVLAIEMVFAAQQAVVTATSYKWENGKLAVLLIFHHNVSHIMKMEPAVIPLVVLINHIAIATIVMVPAKEKDVVAEPSKNMKTKWKFVAITQAINLTVLITTQTVLAQMQDVAEAPSKN